MRGWRLVHWERPWTANTQRKGATHWTETAERTRRWRFAFMVLAKQAKVPPIEAARVIVTPLRVKGARQDTAACYPAAKAAIDGIVDAGVLPDDGPRFLREITFRPQDRAERDGLAVLILEVEGDPRLETV